MKLPDKATIQILRDKLKEKNDTVLELRKEIDKLKERISNLENIEESHKEINGKLQKQLEDMARSPDRSIDDL